MQQQLLVTTYYYNRILTSILLKNECPKIVLESVYTIKCCYELIAQSQKTGLINTLDLAATLVVLSSGPFHTSGFDLWMK